MGFW
jgi:protocatechuate 3,4-dioxygenase beta subunit